MIFNAFTLLNCDVAKYALLRCKIFGLKFRRVIFLTNIMSDVHCAVVYGSLMGSTGAA